MEKIVNQYVANKIKELREKHNLTQQQLADKLNIKQQNIARYELNQRIIKMDFLSRLCVLFGVNFNYFFPSKEEEKEVVKIPVLGVIPAGIPLEAIEDIIDYEEVPKEWLNGNKRYFALKLKGDSMYPKYQTGDVVIFKHQNVFENGDECVVFVNGDDATFKKVFKSENGVTLQPLNHKYDIQTFSKEEVEKLPIKIIGVAFELRRKL